MTDRSKKLLAKLPEKQRKRLEEAVAKLTAGDVESLDMKPLKGHQNLFRIRVGDYRIIIRKTGDSFTHIALYKRDDQTYRDF
jgi:mRNA-degrading endonuclease RelE of RelBE toxin-antitoxin system